MSARGTESCPLLVCICASFTLCAAQAPHAAEPPQSEPQSLRKDAVDSKPTRTAEQEVRSVLQAYIESTRTGNAQQARTLFHPEARMSGQMDDGEARAGTPEAFFKVLDSHPSASSGPHPYSGRITAVTVEGKTATGTIAERNLYGYDFIDHFHLLKSDGRWQIISKLYRGESRPARPPASATPPK